MPHEISKVVGPLLRLPRDIIFSFFIVLTDDDAPHTLDNRI